MTEKKYAKRMLAILLSASLLFQGQSFVHAEEVSGAVTESVPTESVSDGSPTGTAAENVPTEELPDGENDQENKEETDAGGEVTIPEPIIETVVLEAAIGWKEVRAEASDCKIEVAAGKAYDAPFEILLSAIPEISYPEIPEDTET